jgi:hypothetical protein
MAKGARGNMRRRRKKPENYERKRKKEERRAENKNEMVKQMQIGNVKKA